MSAAAVPLPPPPHPATSRFSRPTVIAIFVGALVGILIAAIALIVTRQPPDPAGCEKITCPRVSLGNAQRVGEPWESDLQFGTEWDSENWKAVNNESRLLELELSYKWQGGEFAGTTFSLGMRLEVVPSKEQSSLDLLRHELDVARADIPTLDVDCVDIPGTEWEGACSDRPQRLLQGPAVGYVDGIGGMWAGTSTSGAQLTVVVMAAQHDGVTAAVVVTTDVPFGNGWTEPWRITGFADAISNSIRWPGDQ